MSSRERMIVLIVLGVVIVGLILLYSLKNKPNYNFKVYFFNAGKADAILIENNNHYMMIDTGEEELAPEILSYFKENNITKLDYLIITHFDKDHVGSASSIINEIEIGEIYQSNYPKESTVYTAYLEALESKNITPITVSGDINLSLGDSSLTINGPTEVYTSNESNNSSLIVSLTYQNNKFLFMGDSQNARIKDFLNTNSEEYDFLKVPYHGNYLKRLDTLLKNNNIKYAVITSSLEEKEADETLEILNNYNIKTYLTRNGSITVLSDGDNIVIRQ